MKKLLFVVLMAIVSTATFANGEGDVKVTTDSSSVFKVYYTKPVMSKVTVQILDENGKKVFSEVIAKGEQGFVRPYNLSELPAGVYTFEVTDKEETTRFEFDYNGPVIEPSLMMATIKQLDDQRIFVALANKTKSNVTIKITEGENVVYTSNEMVKGQFAQLFNLKNIDLSKAIIKVFEGNTLIKETSF